MMKKLILIFIAFLLASLLVVSNSDTLMGITSQSAFSPKNIFKSNRHDYGDLYSMSYLPTCKIKSDLSISTIALEPCDGIRDVNLHVLGDCNLVSSYVTNDTMFCGVKNYTFHDIRGGDQVISINKKEKNILLIERSERALIYFADTNYLPDKFAIDSKRTTFKKLSLKEKIERIPLVVGKSLHNSNINQNLESNLFDYNFFTKIKELKAEFNYKVFGRVDNNIAISPDEKFLLYNITVDSSSENSSFLPISNTKVDSIVYSMNAAYRYYKSKGFDEVYFSIIPNTVSILYPNMGKYNNLISRVQDNPKLNVPIIKVYDIFRNTKMQIYFNSDTHWNRDGFNIWVNEFNKHLRARKEAVNQ